MLRSNVWVAAAYIIPIVADSANGSVVAFDGRAVHWVSEDDHSLLDQNLVFTYLI